MTSSTGAVLRAPPRALERNCAARCRAREPCSTSAHARSIARHGLQATPGTAERKSVHLRADGRRRRGPGYVIVQNDERDNAFGDADVRLLADRGRRLARRARERAPVRRNAAPNARESTALSDVGRDLSSTLDLATVMDRIAGHAKELLAAQNSAIFLPDERDGGTLPRHRRAGRDRRRDQGRGRRAGPRHHRQPAAERPGRARQRHGGRPAHACRSPAPRRAATSG